LNIVDLWSKCPIRKLWKIFKSISLQDFTFFWGPQVFFLFLFSPANLFNWKKDLNWKYRRRPLSPWLAQLGADPSSSPCVSRPASQPVTASPSLTDGARLSVLSYQKSNSSARPAWQRQPTCQQRAGHPSPPIIARMPMCAPADLSHHIGCSAPWHPITTAHLRLLSLPLHQSDSRVDRSAMKSSSRFLLKLE
jgi:hypothetical protein